LEVKNGKTLSINRGFKKKRVGDTAWNHGGGRGVQGGGGGGGGGG